MLLFHDATVIWSGVILGALLAFITSDLGKLRHHVTFIDQRVNRNPFENGVTLQGLRL